MVCCFLLVYWLYVFLDMILSLVSDKLYKHYLCLVMNDMLLLTVLYVLFRLIDHCVDMNTGTQSNLGMFHSYQQCGVIFGLISDQHMTWSLSRGLQFN